MESPFEPAMPALKRLIGVPGRLVPYALQRPVLGAVLNEALRKPLARGELDFLEGAAIRIRVLDLNLDWLLTVEAGRLKTLDRSLPENVCIAGGSWDLALLATRRADPDTLFFQRRIRIEGDTELGVAVKNTLSGIDWGDLPAGLRSLLLALSTVIDRLGEHLPARFRA